ncbi:MAG: AAA family ATPase, partial [Rhodospirillales bacterium]|nr:AAA family ATPase [Rhodospirillales bacterium]
MLQVSENELKNRLLFDNPWWERGGSIDSEVDNWPRRAYFEPFCDLISETEIRRAVVLMGPRRVGKTVLCQHAIRKLLDDGVAPENVFYVSIDNPLFAGVSLEQFVGIFQRLHGHDRRP